MVDARGFSRELAELETALLRGKRVLITAPGSADGDSVGAQLAVRKMILHRFPTLEVVILNDEPYPPRYTFMPDSQFAMTPESYAATGKSKQFDLGIIVDGGLDRAGRVREIFEACHTTVFIDHHAVSAKYNYKIRIVDQHAAATTELVFHLSQTPFFSTPIDHHFAQHIYLGLIFDTGFFRHSNTTPEVMELGARLLKTGFDFTRVGERGMLERTYESLMLMSHTLAQARLYADGRIIWAGISQDTLKSFKAHEDDREGIIDHLFLTHGVEVAVLFFELPTGRTKISFRSQGAVDVASFARELTERGGGHKKAAGANLETPLKDVPDLVLPRLAAKLA
ncbi:MAG: DHH family phosphoesterase [Deltaproteobacteria bacterium]|nr:DHH family phosphoesterase [Deltaproteobacteria bacterium]MBI3295345.1 DHH family phosphoesterase [Deltaproteobacteria bacterium]